MQAPDLPLDGDRLQFRQNRLGRSLLRPAHPTPSGGLWRVLAATVSDALGGNLKFLSGSGGPSTEIAIDTQPKKAKPDALAERLSASNSADDFGGHGVRMQSMNILQLNYRRSLNSPGDEFANIQKEHITIWRHSDGTYTLLKNTKKRQIRTGRLDPITAQAILYDLIK